jgi:hypothetical protein
MCNQAHNYIGECTRDWGREETYGGLDRTNLLDVLKIKRQNTLYGIESTPNQEDAYTNTGEDLVPPQGFRDNRRPI